MHDGTSPPSSPDIDKLRTLVERLRAPDGCPWDRKQTPETMRAYVLEEAHEVAAAIESGDPGALAEELGDLLFQVVFLARLGEEDGTFTLAEVIDGIHHKMVERHPHVFGDTRLDDAAAVVQSWEARKASKADGSLLAGVPKSLPALVAAYRLTQKASGVGFDWPSVDQVLDKVDEELGEVKDAFDDSPEALREEVGDLLFAVANLARHLDIDPELALSRTNTKFRRRFSGIEDALRARGEGLADASLEDMDREWERIKAEERANTGPRDP